MLIDRRRILGGGFVFDLQPPSPVTLTVAVLCLALVNAIAEEIFRREVVDHPLARNSTLRRYLFQVVTFGLGHWGGIPHGPVGAVASGAFSASVYRVRERWGLLGGIAGFRPGDRPAIRHADRRDVCHGWLRSFGTGTRSCAARCSTA